MRPVTLVVDAARHNALGPGANDGVQVADHRVMTYMGQVINPREGLTVINGTAELARVALDGPYHEVELLAVAREGRDLETVFPRAGHLDGVHHLRLCWLVVAGDLVVQPWVLPDDVPDVREVRPPVGRHRQELRVSDALVDGVLKIIGVLLVHVDTKVVLVIIPLEVHAHVASDAAVELLAFRWRENGVAAWAFVPSLLPWCRAVRSPS